MSVTAFQAVVTINTATETTPGSGTWLIDFSMLDNEGLYIGYNVQVGDVIVLDTSGLDIGTLSRYTIAATVSTTPFGAVVYATFDLANGTASPDLSAYDTAIKGLITRRTPNLKLLNLPSIQIQYGLSDKFVSYLINYMSTDIVDGLNASGVASTPDWTAPPGEPGEILNKPTLGSASQYDVAQSGDAYLDQVVLGNDSRLHALQALTAASPTPVTIGGIPAGTTFANTPVEVVLLNLLYPYQSPTFSSFSLVGETSPIEVGATVAGGTRTFTWTTTNPSNITLTSIAISDVTTAQSLATSLDNDGSEAVTITPATRTTPGTHVWRISATNTQAASFTRDYTITWQHRRFFGESALIALTAPDITSLRVTALSAGFAGTYAFVAGGYKYVAYASSLGTATTFKDQSTNLDVPFQPVAVVSVTNSYGIPIDYNVHRTTNAIGSAINIVVA